MNLTEFYTRFGFNDVSTTSPNVVKVPVISEEDVISHLDTTGAVLVIDNKETKRSCVIAGKKIRIIDTEILDALCSQESKYAEINFTKLNKAGVYDKDNSCILGSRFWGIYGTEFFTNSFGKKVLMVYFSMLRLATLVYGALNQRNTNGLTLYDDIYSDYDNGTQFLTEFMYPKPISVSSFGETSANTSWYVHISEYRYVSRLISDYKCEYRLIFNTKTLSAYKKQNKLVLYFNKESALHSISNRSDEECLMADDLLTYMTNGTFNINSKLYEDVALKLAKFNPKFISRYTSTVNSLNRQKEIFSINVTYFKNNLQIRDIVYNDLSKGFFTYETEHDTKLLQQISDFLNKPDLYKMEGPWSNLQFRLINKNNIQKDGDYTLTRNGQWLTVKNGRKSYEFYIQCLKTLREVLDIFKDVVPEEEIKALTCEYILTGGK